MTTCTRCQNTGFLNTGQLPEDLCENPDADKVLAWIKEHDDHDVQVCDCCGDGEDWHGEPGYHYGPDDPPGRGGPYEYNGGLCECH